MKVLAPRQARTFVMFVRDGRFAGGTLVPDEGQARLIIIMTTQKWQMDERNERKERLTATMVVTSAVLRRPLRRCTQLGKGTRGMMVSPTMCNSALIALAICFVGSSTPCVVAFQRTSLPRPPHRSASSTTSTLNSPSHPSTQTYTCLNLFDLRERGAANALANSKSYRSTSGLRVAYPKLEIAKLGAGNCPLPHVMELQRTDSRLPSDSRLVARYLEESDLNQVVKMCVREFGSQAPSPESAALPGQLVQSPRTPMDELKDWFEDWTLSLTVQIGLTQRIKRRKDTSAKEPDHHVICLVEEGQGERSGASANTVVGIVELSQQVPDPEQTTPPFIVPYAIKKHWEASAFRIELQYPCWGPSRCRTSATFLCDQRAEGGDIREY